MFFAEVGWFLDRKNPTVTRGYKVDYSEGQVGWTKRMKT